MSFRYPWQRLALLPRFGKQIILLFSDCILLLLSAYLAFVMRLGFVFVPTQTQIFLIAIAPALAIPVFIRFGLYRAIIRYLAERAIWPIFQATAIAALFWVALVFLMESYGGAGLPRSVPLLYWLLSTVLISASRFGAKWLLRSAETNKSYSSTALIIGVGEPGGSWQPHLEAIATRMSLASSILPAISAAWISLAFVFTTLRQYHV